MERSAAVLSRTHQMSALSCTGLPSLPMAVMDTEEARGSRNLLSSYLSIEPHRGGLGRTCGFAHYFGSCAPRDGLLPFCAPNLAGQDGAPSLRLIVLIRREVRGRACGLLVTQQCYLHILLSYHLDSQHDSVALRILGHVIMVMP